MAKMKKNNFLTKAAKGEDSDDGSQLEEQYERLFAKIGRDFVHRDDFFNIMQQVLALIDPVGLNMIDVGARGRAEYRAYEYKQFLEEGRDGSTVYKDLVDLSEDNE